MFKKGDTLIEVTLAIGIFSMVAIAVTSVMTSGTSDAQVALETTLARETIDTQAEALRFIHNSYSSNKEGADQPLTKLWKQITERAITVDEKNESLLQFAPDSCSNVTIPDNAFVINPRTLSEEYSSTSQFVKNTYISPSSGKFTTASTYPRLVFGNASDNDDNNNLSTGANSNNLYHAEGIYVLAVKDSGTTQVTNYNQTSGEVAVQAKSSAFYDFYIRACWDGFGSESSSISTLVRLYDPDAVSTTQFGYVSAQFKPNYDGPPTYGGGPTINPISGRKVINLPNLSNERKGEYSFKGWCDTKPTRDADGNDLCRGSYKATYSPNATLTNNETNTKDFGTLYGVWHKLYTYNLDYYNTNGILLYRDTTGPIEDKSHIFTIKKLSPLQPTNQVFQGWSKDRTNGAPPLYDYNGANNTNKVIEVTTNGAQTITTNLYPVWRTVITFSNAGWTNNPSGAKENYSSSCNIFNITKPTSGSYQTVSAGKSYGGGSTPMAGYLVPSTTGKHVEIVTGANGKGIINLQGFCKQSSGKKVSEGVYYDIGANDTFELTATMNTKGMLIHPNGSVTISIGPLTATIQGSKITSSCNNSAGKPKNYNQGDTLTLKLTKYNNVYALSVNDDELKNCTVSSTGNVKVSYYMHHDSHSCSKIFNVQLYDIDMKQTKR